MKKQTCLIIAWGLVLILGGATTANSRSEAFKENIFNPGSLKPVDSVLKVKVGERAPDFTLPSVLGGKVSLSQYVGKKNVMLSFVPAAWTPVCSDQWPGYNLIQDIFDENNTTLIGITVDNIPTLYAWTRQMVPESEELWFTVLSDFFPHGAVADRYGVLRSDGVAERAVFLIDKTGVIRYIDVHDINDRPSLETIVKEMELLQKDASK
jgi:peroxiredoxin (alkyl hydroperoxide reductase subunit C)